jgi:hypothetical protein
VASLSSKAASGDGGGIQGPLRALQGLLRGLLASGHHLGSPLLILYPLLAPNASLLRDFDKGQGRSG